MSYTDYIIIKFVALVVLSAVVNLIYAAFTGRSIEEARNDKRMEQHASQNPPER